MKLSIIMPVYNGEKYLREAIESALQQNVSPKEILILDNASTDSTDRIIRCFKNPDIRHIRNDSNIGMIDNFRKGLSLASGEYVSFLCYDDVYLPGALASMISRLEKDSSLGFAFGQVVMCDGSGTAASVRKYGLPGRFRARELMLHDFGHGYLCLAATVARRELLLRSGGIRKEDGIFFDWSMWMRLSMLASVEFCDKVVAQYRFHPSNETCRVACNPMQMGRQVSAAMRWAVCNPDREISSVARMAKDKVLFGIAKEVLFRRFDSLAWKSVAEQSAFFLKNLSCWYKLRFLPFMGLAFLPLCCLKGIKWLRQKFRGISFRFA